MSNPTQTRRVFLRTLFPGDHRIWLAAGLAVVLVAVPLLISLLEPRDYLTGTNSVSSEGQIISVPNKKLLCTDVTVPPGTERIAFESATLTGKPTLSVTFKTDQRTYRGQVKSRFNRDHPGVDAFSVPMVGLVHLSSPLFGQVCIKPMGGAIKLGGFHLSPPVGTPITLEGKPLSNQLALKFQPPAGSQKSLVELTPDIFRRAALFRPDIVGPWTFYLLFLLVLPLLWYLAVRLLAKSSACQGRRRSIAIKIAVIAFANAAAWALISPAFISGPDEAEHFAYVQYLNENGKAIATKLDSRAPYSTAQLNGLSVLHRDAMLAPADGHPPWLERDEQFWRELSASHEGRRDDNGGGFTVGAHPHSPLYYAILGIGYQPTSSKSVWSQLTATRLVSALMGMLVAAFGFLMVLELMPRRQTLAIAAGLLVAFEPMAGFMAGSVNNDTGVNALSAITLYLLIRALKRGLTTRTAIALGAVAALLPVMKGTGYFLYPAILVAAVALIYRGHDRAQLSRYLFALGSFVAVLGLWDLIAPLFDRSLFTTPAGSTPGTGAASPANGDFGYLVSYLWQYLWPPQWFAHPIHPNWPLYDIYVTGGWGAFGWTVIDLINFPDWVYEVIGSLMLAIGLLGLFTAWQKRAAIRTRLPEIAVLALVPICIMFGVALAYIPSLGIAEQGRYILPAISALAAFAVGSLVGLGRKFATTVATTLVVLVIGLSYAAQLLLLSEFFS